MRIRLLIILSVIADPRWSFKHWDVVKREWKMERP